MFRKLYDWVMALARSRHAPWALAVISFAESSFFPIPPDVMLAPMVATRPNRAFVYAGICTAASVVGGLLGYSIGVFMEPLGEKILRLFGHPQGRLTHTEFGECLSLVDLKQGIARKHLTACADENFGDHP